MMNIYLILKNTFRNKRFLFFTLVTPILYYIMLIILSKSNGWFEKKYAYIWLFISIIMGIAGNSLISFAKSVNVMRNFYELQIVTSNYTVLKWLRDELMVQLILNGVISIVVTGCALLMGTLAYNNYIVESLILINLFGIYLSVFGFALALILNAKALDASSFFIMLVIMQLLIPFNTFSPNTGYIKIITNIQKLFPSYYLNMIMQNLFMDKSITILMIKLIFTILVTGIIPVLFIMYNLRRKG